MRDSIKLAAAAEPRGMVFRRVSNGLRSSTRAGTAIIGAALEPLNPAHAVLARQERNWRDNYLVHYRRLVDDALSMPAAARASAAAGMVMAWDPLRWGHEGQEHSLEWALRRSAEPAQAEPLHTRTVRGSGPLPPAPWVVPYRGAALSGDRLRRRLELWLQSGAIEPSAGAALHRCAAHSEWFDLSDRSIVLLGAGAQAGPLRWLARWRATVLAVDLERPALWRAIAAIVQGGNATLHVPVRAGAPRDAHWTEVAGADLLTQAPAITNWICRFDAALDVAAHAYLDGERHVRLALAMDLIQRATCMGRSDTTLAFMATPTDVFAVPGPSARAAMQAYSARALLPRALQAGLAAASGRRLYQPHVTGLSVGPDGTEYGVADCLVPQQGSNYALAKRLQQWRALLARAAGHRVSLNIAPSSSTDSVISNPALAAAFAGARPFGVEAFAPETTSALMAALWVHDLRCEHSAANPARALAHPFELFMDNACHGGMWRCAYLPRSVLPLAAALGWVRSRSPRTQAE